MQQRVRHVARGRAGRRAAAAHRRLLERARAQSEIHFIKVKGHLHEELAKVGVTDEDLAPGETYKDLGNVRADELATRAMWSGEHSGYSFR